jgi:hypothetical protein
VKADMRQNYRTAIEHLGLMVISITQKGDIETADFGPDRIFTWVTARKLGSQRLYEFFFNYPQHDNISTENIERWATKQMGCSEDEERLRATKERFSSQMADLRERYKRDLAKLRQRYNEELARYQQEKMTNADTTTTAK